MPRKTLALISGLVILTVILFIIALRSSQQTTRVSTQPTAMQPQPTSPAHSVLTLSPNPVTVSQGQQGSINVNITTSDNQVTAIQLEIGYDPNVVSNLQVTPGPLFHQQPVVLINKNNTQTGRMTYAFGISPDTQPINGTGVVATITFTAIGKAGQQSQLALLPTTLVTARGVAQSVLKSASGTIVSVVASGTVHSTIAQPTAMLQHALPATRAGY